MDIAVLMGGLSTEREISILSGTSIAAALERKGHTVERFIVREDFPDRVSALKRYDVVFIALHGGAGEDGRIQAMLEKHGIIYTGSGVEASRTLMDKIATKQVLDARGIGTPPWFLVSPGSLEAETLPKGFSFPVVVKQPDGGSSVNVFIVRDGETYREAVRNVLKFGETVLVESYIKGRELTVGILGDVVLPVIELVPHREFYDFNAKYTDDTTEYLCPAPLTERERRRVMRMVVEAFNAFGCRDIVRFDVIMDSAGTMHLLEGNTIPGFTDHSLVPLAARIAGIPFDEVCNNLVEMAWRRTGRTACLQEN